LQTNREIFRSISAKVANVLSAGSRNSLGAASSRRKFDDFVRGGKVGIRGKEIRDYPPRLEIPLVASRHNKALHDGGAYSAVAD
jgi:hypothetical protein